MKKLSRLNTLKALAHYSNQPAMDWFRNRGIGPS